MSFEFRSDGILRNTLMGFGDPSSDIEKNHRPDTDPFNFSAPELEALYEKDAIAAKIVDLLPDKALAAGYRIKVGGKPIDRNQVRAIRHSGIFRHLCNALKLSRLYPRGAAVVLDIDDGQGRKDPVSGGIVTDFSQPINKRNIRSVKVAFIADGQRIYPEDYSIIDVPPERYFMTLTDAESASVGEESQSLVRGIAQGQYIHRDRVLWLDGAWTPPNIKVKRNGSISLLARFWHHYARYEAAKAQQQKLLAQKELVNVKRKNLGIMLATASKEAESSLKREAANYRKAIASESVILSDADDVEFELIKRDLQHTKDVIEEARYSFIAASGGLTELDIFGLTTGTAGLAKDGLRDRSITNDAVIRIQETQLREPFERFLELLILSQDNPLKIQKTQDWDLEFKSALTLNPSEELEMRNKQSTIDKNSITDLKLPPEWVIASRWGTGEWEPGVDLPENWEVKLKERKAEAQQQPQQSQQASQPQQQQPQQQQPQQQQPQQQQPQQSQQASQPQQTTPGSKEREEQQ